MNNKFIQSWKKYVKNLDDVLDQMHQQTTIAIGVVPYQRIMPALFMKRAVYQIYSVRDSADLDVLRNYANIYCLNEKNPKLAAKVQATQYLMRNYMFQGYLKNIRGPYNLLFYQTTKPIIDYLNEQNIPWIGNDPNSFEPVLHKATFRNLLKSLKLKHLEDQTLTKKDFEQKTFAEISKKWNGSVVVQPGDYEISGGTQFVHNQEDLDKALFVYKTDERYLNKVKTIKISKFVSGDSLSMMGCVTEQGILSGSLQLQLVDVPESLHGYPASGMFFGHNWGDRSWSDEQEQQAQKMIETIGRWLYRRGYRGIFGLDFLYDLATKELYPIECNPRYTGAIPIFSQLNMEAGTPPIDFFTLAAYLKIPIKFDFDGVNKAWKKPLQASHIAITPQGISQMKLNLAAGIYTYHEHEKTLEYLRPGAFLHELKNDKEFIIIDQVPRLGQKVMENVPRLFKFVFRTSIAEGTNKIKQPYSDILTNISNLLRK